MERGCWLRKLGRKCGDSGDSLRGSERNMG